MRPALAVLLALSAEELSQKQDALRATLLLLGHKMSATLLPKEHTLIQSDRLRQQLPPLETGRS